MLFSPLGYLGTILGMADGTLGQLAVVRLRVPMTLWVYRESWTHALVTFTNLLPDTALALQELTISETLAICQVWL